MLVPAVMSKWCSTYDCISHLPFKLPQAFIRPLHPFPKADPFTNASPLLKSPPRLQKIPLHLCKISQIDRRHGASLVTFLGSVRGLYRSCERKGFESPLAGVGHMGGGRGRGLGGSE